MCIVFLLSELQKTKSYPSVTQWLASTQNTLRGTSVTGRVEGIASCLDFSSENEMQS